MSKNVNLQTFFDGAPSADEIDYHISNNPVFWNTATPSEAIEEIKFLKRELALCQETITKQYPN